MTQSRVAVLLTLAVLAGCDYSINLPNGFEFVRLDAAEGVIAFPDKRIAIDPDVQTYAVVNEVITGFADIPERRMVPEQGPSGQADGWIVHRRYKIHKGVGRPLKGVVACSASSFRNSGRAEF